MGNTYKNEFYKCITCKNNICLLCKKRHNSKHKLIRYEKRNYICPKHNDVFSNYCTKCKVNICFSCNKEHKDHNTIFFGDIIPSMEETENKINEIKTLVDSLNDKIKRIIKQLNELIETVDLYYQINEEILNNFDPRNKNYDILYNINEIIRKNRIFEEVKIINMSNKLNDVLDFYYKINT